MSLIEIARRARLLLSVLILSLSVAAQSADTKQLKVDLSTLPVIKRSPTLPIPPPSSVCVKSIQGKVAWNRSGAKRWNSVNINKLCGRAHNSKQPGYCFDRVMHRNRAPDASNPWTWRTVTQLCKGSLNANHTIQCFNSALGKGINVTKARNWCGDYANIKSNKKIEIGLEAPDNTLPPISMNSESWSAVNGISLTPNEETRRRIQRSQYSSDSRHTRRIKNVRFVSKNGFLSRTVPTFDGNALDQCRRACANTGTCSAFVIKDSTAQQTGGYCGLVFDDLYRRYDKHWVQGSRGFTTYFDPSLRQPRMLPVRLVVEARSGDNSELTRPLLRELKDSATSTSSVIGCATSCVIDENCQSFIRNTRSCLLFANPATSDKPKMKTYFGEFDFMGVVANYDRPGLNRSSVEYDVSKGLSLFGPRALRSAQSYTSEAGLSAEELSAYVLPDYPIGRAWTGDQPPHAETPSDAAFESIDLTSFIVGAEGRTGYLPFDEKVWASATEPGTYYFVPRKFRFAWDSINKKLGGSQFFNAAGTVGDGNDVRLSIKLSGTFHEDDLLTFKEVVNAYLVNANKPQVTRLKRFPLDSPPTIDLARSLSGLGVGQQQVEAPALNTDLIAPIHLTFSVNDLTAKSLLENFTAPDGEPLGGNLIVNSSKVGSEPMLIPIELDARDPMTYGGERVINGRWKNVSPYPAKIKRLNILLIRPDKVQILSWNASDHPFIETGKSTQFNLDSNAHRLISQAKRIWVDYALDQSCRACAESALGLAAVSGAARNRVTFRLLPNFRDTRPFDQIKINFRSRHLSADSDDVQSAESMFLFGDENSVESPPLFLSDAVQLDNDKTVYQYRVTKYYDGSVQCIAWTDGSERDVILTPSRFAEVEDDCSN